MRITQRQIGIGIQAFIAGINALLALYYLATGGPLFSIISVALSTVFSIVLLVSYILDWRYAIPVLLIVSMLVIGFTPPAPIFSLEKIFVLFIPPILAILLSRTRWVIPSIIIPFTIFVGRTGLEQMPSQPAFYTLFVIIAAGFILARLSIDTALDDANANAAQANQARLRSEEQAHELGTMNTQMSAQISEQQRLLELVVRLETPISNLADGVLFMPLMGSLDQRRLQVITENILKAASQQRIKLVILDIAGLSDFTQSSAQGLLAIAQALRLLGCQVTVSGISSVVAITLADMDVHLQQIETVRSPQEALERFQRRSTPR